MTTKFDTCPICKRQCGGVMEEHHLKPKTFRTRTTSVHDRDNLIKIHRICHQKIHSTFSEQELFSHYHTIDRLTTHPEIEKFVKWIRKKPVDFYDKNDDTRHRRKKRRK